MSLQSFLGRNSWLQAAIWLVFLGSPIAVVLSDDALSGAASVVAIGLIAVFAVVYIQGFRLGFGRVEPGSPGFEHHLSAVGWPFLAVLSILVVLIYGIAGAAAVGVMPFVASFAAFHMRPVVAFGITVACFALGFPMTAGVQDGGWLPMITLGVGLGTMGIRAIVTAEHRKNDVSTLLAVSDERNRVARDVHDVLGHSLTVISLKMELCERLLTQVRGADDDSAAALATCGDQLRESKAAARGALAEIRSTVGGLRSLDLRGELVVAAAALADAGVTLEVRGEDRAVPAQQQEALAWVVRESVTNVIRHAHATLCRIEVAPLDATTVLLRVTDDGVGSGASPPGNGLSGLTERVNAVGADLRVGVGCDNGDGQGGTTVEVVAR